MSRFAESLCTVNEESSPLARQLVASLEYERQKAHEAWLAQRMTGIGATDCAPILGLSPWKTALHVFLEKLGQYRQEETEAMRLGKRLEPLIAELYTEYTGREVNRDNLFRRHYARDWQIATLDAEADGRDVEFKTVGAFSASSWGEPGSDEIPDHYNLQVQHQMAVTGHKAADVAVLFGGQRFVVYTVERNKAVIDALTEREWEFWKNHVLAKVQPPPDWTHHVTKDVIRLLHGWDANELAYLGSENVELVQQYDRLGQLEKATGESRATIKSQLLYAMKEAARAELPDGTILTRKPVNRKAYSVEASTYMDFRIKRPREITDASDSNTQGEGGNTLAIAAGQPRESA